MSELIFEGNVQVYLQGKNALVPDGSADNKFISYFVGSRLSALTVTDFRHAPNVAAHHVLSGKNGVEFADVFNEPALVKVYAEREDSELHIEMYQTNGVCSNEILWLGVVDDQEMSVQNLEWEVLRPIGEEHAAFAALVKRQPDV